MAESDNQTKLVITSPNNEVTSVIFPDKVTEKTEMPQIETLNIDTASNEELEVFDYNAIAINMVQFQVEYHFSDANLALDNHLLSKLHQDKQYWVPIQTVANLSKIKAITEDIDIILKAIRTSGILILSDDETKVKRKDFIPPKPKHHKNMRRTVFIYGLSDNDNDKKIIEICSNYGKLSGIIFDNGSKYILNKERMEESDLEPIDRQVAIAIMTKKFGPRAIRSNSASFSSISSAPGSATNNIPTLPHSPVFVHPIANPNNDPLDFSHLKTCFAIFESQSQANNFVKSRARTNDGIKTLHQYEYIKYQKRESMNKARGISALISPNSINLALNSPTYAMIGCTKQNNNKQQIKQHSYDHAYDHTYDHTYNHAYAMTAPMTAPLSAPLPIQSTHIDAAAQMAMEFYLTNYNSGTPMLIVPTPIADAMAQTFADKLNHSAQKERRKTWNHKQRGNNYYDNGHFDFDNRYSNESNHKNHQKNHKNKRHHRYNYGGSKSMTHRNMRHSWRNSSWRNSNHQPKGAIPPVPSPNDGIRVISNASSNATHYVLKNKKKYKQRHSSPAITPMVSSFVDRATH